MARRGRARGGLSRVSRPGRAGSARRIATAAVLAVAVVLVTAVVLATAVVAVAAGPAVAQPDAAAFSWVRLDGFSIARTEMTLAQWRSHADATGQDNWR